MNNGKKVDANNQNGAIPEREKSWKRQFSVEEDRVSEFVELYESIGYEVRVELTVPNEKKECQACYAAESDKYRTIFIRRDQKKE